jgi:hypothetical protein
MRLRAMGVGGLCLGALGVAAALSVPAATTGCTTHQCDSDFVNIDQSTGTLIGDVTVLDPQTGAAVWESSPIDGTWIDFPGQRTYFVALPPYFAPGPGLPSAWIATGPTPDQVDASSTYVQGGGQLAEFGPFVNGGFLVTNASCAYYYLYISVPGTYSPPPAPAPGDGGGGD